MIHKHSISKIVYVIILLAGVINSGVLMAQTSRIKFDNISRRKISKEFYGELRFLGLSKQSAKKVVDLELSKLSKEFSDGSMIDNKMFYFVKDSLADVSLSELGYIGVASWNDFTELLVKRQLVYELDHSNMRLVDEMMVELKLIRPNGYLINKTETGKNDSLFNAVYIKICKRKGLNGFIKWGDANESLFTSSILKLLVMDKELSQEQSKETSRCIVSQLQTKYPDGISFFISKKDHYKSFLKEITESCTKKNGIYH